MVKAIASTSVKTPTHGTAGKPSQGAPAGAFSALLAALAASFGAPRPAGQAQQAAKAAFASAAPSVKGTAKTAKAATKTGMAGQASVNETIRGNDPGAGMPAVPATGGEAPQGAGKPADPKLPPQKTGTVHLAATAPSSGARGRSGARPLSAGERPASAPATVTGPAKAPADGPAAPGLRSGSRQPVRLASQATRSATPLGVAAADRKPAARSGPVGGTRGQRHAPGGPLGSQAQTTPSVQTLIATHAPAAVHGPPGGTSAAGPTPAAGASPPPMPDPGAVEHAAPGVQLTGSGNGQWRLNVAPPGLGPVHIDLGLQQGQGINAQFWVQHPAAASTIQGGLAELRGALASGGLSLGQFGVALGSGGRQQPEPRQRQARSAAALRPVAAVAAGGPRSTSIRGLDVLG